MTPGPDPVQSHLEQLQMAPREGCEELPGRFPLDVAVGPGDLPLRRDLFIEGAHQGGRAGIQRRVGRQRLVPDAARRGVARRNCVGRRHCATGGDPGAVYDGRRLSPEIAAETGRRVTCEARHDQKRKSRCRVRHSERSQIAKRMVVDGARRRQRGVAMPPPLSQYKDEVRAVECADRSRPGLGTADARSRGCVQFHLK